MIDFNINNYVHVKLTDVGRRALKENHDELNRFARGCLGDYKPMKEDADGWSKWQLWSLMEELGNKCTHGMNTPFETNIRIDN